MYCLVDRFLRTAKAKIYCSEWSISLEFFGNTVKFNMSENAKLPCGQHSVNFLDLLDPLIHEVNNIASKDPLEIVLCNSITKSRLTALENVAGTQKKLTRKLNALEQSKSYMSGGFSHLRRDSNSKKIPSILQAPELELKPLPLNLKYAFLGKDDTLPVIISSKLTATEEEQLVNLLKKNKKAIGWTLADILGISPSICTHKIHTEEDKKSVRQPQRRLNPPMMDVVKQEIIKLKDA